LKQTINIGTYGWQHPQWVGSFYPEDLPQDWQLTYYSNEFNAVMVPADYWSGCSEADSEQWRESVHEKFKFYVQCDVSMLDDVKMQVCMAGLAVLQPQLAALVYLGEENMLDESEMAGFESLALSLDCDLVGIALASGGNAVWRQAEPVVAKSPSNFAYIESELTDLRAVRVVFEEFIGQLEGDTAPAMVQRPGDMQKHPGRSAEACIIVDHPGLQVSDISAARAVLEIMGY